MWYTIASRSRGDGSEPAYLVYFEREIVAVFPVLDPTSGDAREYATRFIDTMNGYYMRRRAELVGLAEMKGIGTC
jgi:hypothetical protein